MSETESRDLSARLHEAVDDRHITVPDLLSAARSRRRRRRGLVGLAAVTVVVAGAVALSQLPGMAPRTAVVAAPSSATPSSTPVTVTPSPAALTTAAIVERCLPQLAKYKTLPMYAQSDSWRVPHLTHLYHPGDMVALVNSVGGNQAFCRIPEAGHEGDDVPFSALEPLSLDATDRAEMCSESMRYQPTMTPGVQIAEFDYNTPDLRDASVLASQAAGKMVVLLLRHGTATYVCHLTPLTWDIGRLGMSKMAEEPSLHVGVEGSATGAAGKSLVPGPATYYLASGRLPDNARTIEFTVGKKLVHTTTPTSDGWWVATWLVDGRNSLQESQTYAIKDAAGKVLATGAFS